MPIRVGSQGPQVTAWQKAMVARFKAYAKAADGSELKADGYFGNDDAAVQREYELRTRQVIDGIVSDHDLQQLGITAGPPAGSPAPGGRPVLFTVHGTGQPDPLGPGLPADIARHCLDKLDWQPIGNYPARPFPMWPSVELGRAELNVQIDRHPGRPITLCGYSQGAIVVGQVLKHDIMAPGGRLHHRLKDVRKVVLLGNPMRQKGIAHFDYWIHPVASAESRGILDDRLEGLAEAPFQTRDYAHEGDMYASVLDNDRDEYKIAIGKIVMRANDFYLGDNSVVAQLRELGERPISEGIAMAMAMIDALKFFTNTAHGYNIGPAIEFLRA